MFFMGLGVFLEGLGGFVTISMSSSVATTNKTKETKTQKDKQRRNQLKDPWRRGS